MPCKKKLPYLQRSVQVVVVTIGASVVVLEDTDDVAGEVGAVVVDLEDTDDVEVVVVTQAFTFNAKSLAYPLPLKLIRIVSTSCMLLITNLPNISFCIQNAKFNMVLIF